MDENSMKEIAHSPIFLEDFWREKILPDWKQNQIFIFMHGNLIFMQEILMRISFSCMKLFVQACSD